MITVGMNILIGFEGGTNSVLSLILIYSHQAHRANYKIETLPLGRQITKKIPFASSLQAGPRAQQVDLGLDFICTWGLVLLCTVHLYTATLYEDL